MDAELREHCGLYALESPQPAHRPDAGSSLAQKPLLTTSPGW
jgi:hypothetical protein